MAAEESERSPLPFEPNKKRHKPAKTVTKSVIKTQETQETQDKNSEKDIDPSNTKSDEHFEVGRPKNGSSKIDYAATIESAYDELNKVLGSDGIKRLTTDTQSLMKQQLQLAESMKSMAPLIQGMAPMMKQAQEMLSGMGEGSQGLGGIMDIAKKLTKQ
jgi:hypothetical protein